MTFNSNSVIQQDMTQILPKKIQIYHNHFQEIVLFRLSNRKILFLQKTSIFKLNLKKKQCCDWHLEKYHWKLVYKYITRKEYVLNVWMMNFFINQQWIPLFIFFKNWFLIDAGSDSFGTGKYFCRSLTEKKIFKFKVLQRKRSQRKTFKSRLPSMTTKFNENFTRKQFLLENEVEIQKFSSRLFSLKLHNFWMTHCLLRFYKIIKNAEIIKTRTPKTKMRKSKKHS